MQKREKKTKIFLQKTRAQEMSLISGNSHENSRPVVIEMTLAKPKTHHVFCFTCLTELKIGALSPVIL